MINKYKDKIQQEVRDKLNKEKSGLIIAATGSGKSRGVILHVNDCYTAKSNVLYATPTEIARDVTAPAEFEKWKSVVKPEFVCYRSMATLTGGTYDLVILDECQWLTEMNFAFFENNKVRNIIAMTPKLPKKELKQDLLLFNLQLPILVNITVAEAEDNQIVPNFDLYVIKIPLSRTLRYYYKDKDGWKYRTEAEEYRHLCKMIQEYDEKGLPLKNPLMSRYRFLAYNKGKHLVARHYLLQAVEKGRRMIVFAGNKKQGAVISKHQYHTSSGDKHLKDFVSGKINELVTIGKFDQAVNFDFDGTIICHLQSDPLRTIQRLGRTLRSVDGNVRKVMILVSENTVEDDVWLKSFIQATKQPTKVIELKWDPGVKYASTSRSVAKTSI